MQNIVLIDNLRTTWPTKILMPFLCSSDNLLQDAYISFPKKFDHFEILVWDAVSPIKPIRNVGTHTHLYAESKIPMNITFTNKFEKLDLSSAMLTYLDI